MSELIIIYAGEDEASAKALLKQLRERLMGGVLRSAFFLEGLDDNGLPCRLADGSPAYEDCGRVIIMEDVPNFIADKIETMFRPGKCERRHADPPKTADVLPYVPRETSVGVYPMPKRRGRPPKVRPEPIAH